MLYMTLNGSAAITVRSLRIENAPDALSFLADVQPTVGPRFYWSAWDDDLVIAACGLAIEVKANGPQRLEEIATTIARETPDPDPGAPRWAAPRWIGGFGFSDRPDAGWEGFEPAWFCIPERTLVIHGHEAHLTIVAAEDRIEAVTHEALTAIDAARCRPLTAGPAAGRTLDGCATIDLSPGLAGQIDRAVSAIRDGQASKVVLATSHHERLSAPADAVGTLIRMRDQQPGCTHFLVSPDPSVSLIGATPERLIRVSGERLDTMALAGTARRGDDEASDVALGKALEQSQKDRDEHEHVIEGIRRSLADCDLRMDASPALRRLATVQHLETRLVGARPAGARVLDLAARLHPTPALGGTPTRAALRLIGEIEPEGRGWYGGSVGWLDGEGDGDLAVVIRALLLRHETVTAFAGAGLVATSVPERELDEIALKLRAALGAIEGDEK